MTTEKFDLIVVGAGPAGLSAAYIAAKAGLKVIVIERGEYPGSKNVMGGILYRQPTEEVFPEFWKEAPLELPIVEQKIWVLDKKSGVTFGYKGEEFAQEPYNCFSVLRAKLDRWFARKVEEAGALIITETVVEDLIMEDGYVIGVKTGREDGNLYANIVILAEGVNSLLAQKIDMQTWLPAHHLAVAVKEIIALPKEKIMDRFSLEEGQGATIELFGEATQGMVGTAFIYTNKESLSIGVGTLISDMVKRNVNPNDLLEHMKSHPMIRPLIAGGETKEYMAHMIPEAGYKGVPKLYGNGVLICGDAAMLVNGIHREGSNLAMMSGKYAAETVIKAKQNGIFSAESLIGYQKALENSFILKDLEKYQNTTGFLEHNDHFLSLYPKILSESAREFYTVDNIPKREKQKIIWNNITKQRPKWQLAKDLFRFWRVMG